MLPADVEHYFSEITRVMKPGAHCLATWFLLNEEADRHIKKGEAFLPFSDRLGACRVANRDIPEVAIAYPESDIEAIYASHGMKKVTQRCMALGADDFDRTEKFKTGAFIRRLNLALQPAQSRSCERSQIPNWRPDYFPHRHFQSGRVAL